MIQLSSESREHIRKGRHTMPLQTRPFTSYRDFRDELEVRLAEFKKEFPVVKEVYPIRVHGVSVEEILTVLDEGLAYEPNDVKMATFYFPTFCGIPGAYVGCEKIEDWERAREYLRYKRVIR